MRILGIDYGDARIGLAITDALGITAQGLETIHHNGNDKTELKRIEEVVNEYGVTIIVVGKPLNMDGSKGESAKAADEFSKILSKYTDADIILQDERGTTISAHSYLNVTNTRGEKRKSVVDAVAATIILQDYLDFRRNNKWELQRTWM